MVADRFGKATKLDSEGRLTYPGDGIYGHKEGYNVLYGDGSVRWYGDPQQSHIWKKMPMDSGGSYASAGGNNTLYFYSWMNMSYGIGYFSHFDEGELHYREAGF